MESSGPTTRIAVGIEGVEVRNRDGGTFGVEYDNLGRITALPAEYSGGGKLSTSYYVNDLTHSQSQGGSPTPMGSMRR